MENFADLYSDYLISSSSYTTATGMASLLSIRHDKVTRALSTGNYDSKFLWKKAKVYIQEMTQSKETVYLSFDDSIEEKRYTDESELNCWHYDHVVGRSVKGVNFLTALVEVALWRRVREEGPLGDRPQNGEEKTKKRNHQERNVQKDAPGMPWQVQVRLCPGRQLVFIGRKHGMCEKRVGRRFCPGPEK